MVMVVIVIVIKHPNQPQQRMFYSHLFCVNPCGVVVVDVGLVFYITVYH